MYSRAHSGCAQKKLKKCSLQSQRVELIRNREQAISACALITAPIVALNGRARTISLGGDGDGYCFANHRHAIRELPRAPPGT